ncbi:tetratricopeptide repeat protein [Pyxidicoccus parkwayensis]|uniref:non-specific serine/threonine protein kinase n=1 Tax=Pyxidicoccus parkwayensis TaxID=2813578 RepID=A0ABX7NQT9_9BACT|nr:tetratricopeptide repeat protein [Pyxidicoccus parkwaysis]QSQ19819.1 tetratricopeptide repeat protein [Pyxidicoccus parkwaysis]
MKACPQETTLSDFLAGVLSDEHRSLVMAHVEQCADCQWVLAAGDGARALTSPPATLVGALFAPLARGATVSRYVVRERLGAGAMGVVYAADDPELGRQVALKVLRPEGRQREDLQQRLLREAQALARLSHTNVVTLYDVGTFGDGIFLAMELVEGTTLAEWMKEPRPWKEVLRVFLEAGRGLAAAHAAGLVHRDFKPANTLLGRNGRVCVTDFGIARLLHQEDAPSPPAGVESSVPSTGGLTRTGLVLGTPAYLAPELLQGQRADARSDEFSFCVALYEALFGVRPFQGETLRELAQAIQQGRVHAPGREVKVPSRVRRAVLRGLRAEPSERFPSMESLLAALTPPPRRMLARVLSAAAVAGVLGALAAYGLAHRRGAGCEQEVEKLAAAWGPARRERVRAAFLATGTSYAASAWERLASAMDDYAAQWRTLRIEACQAAGNDTARGAQRTGAGKDTVDGAWQTAACLDTRLWQLAAVTDVLEKADAVTVQNAHQLTASLEGLAACRDAPGLSNRPQPPDALRPRVDAARHELAQARAHLVARRITEGLAVTSALLEELKGLDYKPLHAEVLLVHGELLGQGDRPKEAESFIDLALWAAEAARDDETVARAWLEHIWVVGELLSRPADAEKLVQHARAAVERLGRERFPDIATDLHLRLASLRDQQGRLDEAEQEALQGLELWRRRSEPDSLRTASLLHALGRIRMRQRRFEESLELHRQALEIRKRLLGSDNPALAISYDRVASALSETGRQAEAIDALRTALKLQEASSIPENSVLAGLLLNLGTHLRAEGRLEEVSPLLERARTLFEKARGPDHFTVVQVLTEQAMVYGEAGQHEKTIALTTEALERIQRSMGPDTPRANFPLTIRAYAYLYSGRYAEARRDLLDALKRLETSQGPGGASTVSVLLPLAEVALASRAPTEALEYCERARKLTEKTQGLESEDGASALTCTGEAHLALGAAEKAVPLLERARNIQTRRGEPADRWVAGKTAFALARALAKTHSAADRARALAMAEEAHSLLESLGARGREDLQKVQAWQRDEARR